MVLSEANPISEFGDPLSDVTRKERRLLIVISAIDYFVIRSGALPTKIAALGIEFDKANQQSFLALLAVATSYLLLAFLLYAGTDFLRWRKERHYQKLHSRHLLDEKMRDYRATRTQDDDLLISTEPFSIPAFRYFAGPIIFLRTLFEFVLPVVASVYAIALLVIAGARI